ncbi:MAG: hypothetical protein E6K63_08645 [Nitrospirae bacterium]|nr:MAG: hypothetical protein E6K63_08645 [Nitrospirota bacterium]
MLPWTLLVEYLDSSCDPLFGLLSNQRDIRMTDRRAVRLLLLACAVFLVSAPFTLAQETSHETGTWQSMASAPSMRTEVVGAALGGKVYVMGGFNEPSLTSIMNLAVSDAVEEYDSSTNRWTTKALLPIGLHHAGAASVGGRLYIIGGFTKSLFSVWQPVASVYIYNPETDSWTERAPMPTKRGALAVAELGGKLVAIGGYDGSGNSSAVEVYDPAANSWSTKAPLPTARDHLAVATVGTQIYAIGGRLNRDYARNLAVTESYDSVADRWTRVADLPTPRSGIAAAVVREVIYVFGGEAPEGTFQVTEAYSPGTDRWRTMTPMPTGRHGLASAVVNDRVYVISGGPRPGGSFSNVNEMFVPPSTHTGAREKTRASPTQVGTIMALLAAFGDGGALPAESSPEANRLIKALIQFQAAFMKSTSPAVQRLLTEALTEHLGERAQAAADSFRADGWNSQALEAVVTYVAMHSVWDQPGLEEGLQAYNIGRNDFDLLAQTFLTARATLGARGQDFHTVYASRRRDMPGARSTGP